MEIGDKKGAEIRMVYICGGKARRRTIAVAIRVELGHRRAF